MMDEKVTFVVGDFLKYIKSSCRIHVMTRNSFSFPLSKEVMGGKKNHILRRIKPPLMTKTRTIEPFLNWLSSLAGAHISKKVYIPKFRSFQSPTKFTQAMLLTQNNLLSCRKKI